MAPDPFTVLMRTPTGLVRCIIDSAKDRPHIDSRPTLRREERDVQAAWQRLSCVPELSSQTAADVSLVLERTIAHPLADPAELTPLQVATPKERPRPTAAHPRAYQGTKKQPPKAPRGAPVDLRPYLCSSRGIDALFARLREILPTAGEQEPLTPPFEGWTYPPGLRMAMGLRWRAGWTSAMRDELAALWRQIDAESEERLASGLAAVAAEFDGPTVLACVRGLAAVLPKQRLDILAGLRQAMSHVNWSHPETATLAELSLVAAGADDGHTVDLTSWIVLMGQTPTALHPAVLAGVQLAARYGESEPVHGNAVPSEDAARCLMEIADEWSHVDPTALNGLQVLCAWSQLGSTPRLQPIYRRLLLELRSGHLASEFLESLWIFVRAFEYDVGPQRRNAFLEHFDEIIDAFVAAPKEWHIKAHNCYYHVAWEEQDGIENVMARVASTILRWCRPPFSTSENLCDVLLPLAPIEQPAWDRWMAAPDKVLLDLESVAKRRTDAVLIAVALESAVEIDLDWTLQMLIERTKPMARLLRLAGMLSNAAQRQLIRSGLARFATPPSDAWSLKETVQFIDGLPLPTGANPVPSRVRQHLSGADSLTEEQVARHLQRIRASWPDTALACMRHAIMEALATGVLGGPAGDGASLSPEAIEALPNEITHALMLQSDMGENRRSLRRLIRAVLGGDETYLARHPENQRWMSELRENVSEEAARVWQSPPVVNVEVDGIGPVTIGPEHRPLEALRMGTYVGSCYGLGGSFRYAAAAVVLDVNKHVLFARRADGTFLGRQIIGVSNAWTLHCSYVYPVQEEGPLLDAFLDYDRALAGQCGLPLAGSDDEDSESIDCLVAEDAWEEGVIFGS